MFAQKGSLVFLENMACASVYCFSNNDDIANVFATCFEKVCPPNSARQNEALRVDFE